MRKTFPFLFISSLGSCILLSLIKLSGKANPNKLAACIAFGKTIPANKLAANSHTLLSDLRFISSVCQTHQSTQRFAGRRRRGRWKKVDPEMKASNQLKIMVKTLLTLLVGKPINNEDPYHETANPSGVIQMGLAENQVSFDLLEKYLEEHREALTWGSKGASGFRENALFQDYHGLESFRSAMASFMQQIRGGKAKFDPARIVLTAGATAANELLTFILENPGDALLVPRVSNCGCGRVAVAVAVAVVAVAAICGRRCGVK